MCSTHCVHCTWRWTHSQDTVIALQSWALLVLEVKDPELPWTLQQLDCKGGCRKEVPTRHVLAGLFGHMGAHAVFWAKKVGICFHFGWLVGCVRFDCNCVVSWCLAKAWAVRLWAIGETFVVRKPSLASITGAPPICQALDKGATVLYVGKLTQPRLIWANCKPAIF